MLNKTHIKFLMATVATMLLFPGGAYANDPEQQVYPAKPWTIQRITPSDQAAPNPICTLTNRFGDSSIMEFSGTSRGFETMKISFAGPVFDPGKTYQVNYSVPGMAEASSPASSQQPNVLITDFKDKANLSEAMKMASVLDLGVEDRAIRFYLTGFAAAMKEFERCSAPGTLTYTPSEEFAENLPAVAPAAIESPTTITPEAVPAAAEATAPPIAAAPDTGEVETALRNPAGDAPQAQPHAIAGQGSRMIDKLDRELKEQSQQYRPDAQAMAPDFAAQEQTAASQAPAAEESSIIKPEAGEVQTPPVETPTPEAASSPPPPNPEAAVTEEAAPAPAPEPVAEIAPETKPEAVSAEAPASAKEEAVVEEPKTTSIKIPAVKIVKESASMEAVDLTKVGLEEAAPEPEKTTSEKIANADIPDAKPEISSGGDFSDMREKIMDLESRVASLSKENQQLDEELKATLHDAQEERLSVSSDNWDLERATMRFNEAERQIARLGRELQTQKAACDAEKQKLEGMLFDPEVTNQQQLSRLSELEGQLEDLKSKSAIQQRTYEEKIRLLEEQLNKR